MNYYTDLIASYVYNKMCNFHRRTDRTHSCKNPLACRRASRLAAWLEDLIELDEECLIACLSWAANKIGSEWRDVENRIRVALCEDLRGME